MRVGGRSKGDAVGRSGLMAFAFCKSSTTDVGECWAGTPVLSRVDEKAWSFLSLRRPVTWPKDAGRRIGFFLRHGVATERRIG